VANGGDKSQRWFVLALVLLVLGALVPTLYFLLD
jgi:hypothetical protein